MPPSRLSTVYDFSSLRLHPDGSRVHQDARNLRFKDKNHVVRDAQGNWFARDAAGRATVKKYRRGPVVETQEEESEKFDFDFGDEEDRGRGGAGSTKGKGKEMQEDWEDEDEMPYERFKTSRARRRHRFLDNNDFLEPTSIHSQERLLSTQDDTLILPPPSSDLLKCIHHIASSYYTEQGKLLNLTKQARAEKKQRRLARLAEAAKTRATPRNEELSLQDENDQSASDHSEGHDPVNSPPKSTGIKKRKQKHLSPEDMYKTMDGSALMAIGMLLQEHIAEALRPYLSLNSGEGDDSEEEMHEGEGELNELDPGTASQLIAESLNEDEEFS